MPEMDGMEFLKKLRKINLMTQIIMMTGYNAISLGIGSLENDACNYLVKPVSRELILESIKRAERNLGEKLEMMMRSTNLQEPNYEKKLYN